MRKRVPELVLGLEREEEGTTHDLANLEPLNAPNQSPDHTDDVQLLRERELREPARPRVAAELVDDALEVLDDGRGSVVRLDEVDD